MAFHVSNEVGLCPPSGCVDAIRKIPSVGIAHGCLRIAIIQISPKQHTIVRELILFRIVGKVFEYSVAARRLQLNSIIISLPDCYAARVIGAPCRHVTIVTRVVTCLCLRKSFRKIKAKTIYFIIRQPVFNNPAYKVSRRQAFMIHVEAHVECMLRHRVKPWIVCGGAIVGRVPI